MKFIPILIVALITVALPTAVLAAHTKGSDANNSSTAQTGGENHSFYRRVLSFPGHVIYSVARTPLILGETAMGQRRFISRDGFFAADEKQRRSLTLRRVAFAGDVPDND